MLIEIDTNRMALNELIEFVVALREVDIEISEVHDDLKQPWLWRYTLSHHTNVEHAYIVFCFKHSSLTKGVKTL